MSACRVPLYRIFESCKTCFNQCILMVILSGEFFLVSRLSHVHAY